MAVDVDQADAARPWVERRLLAHPADHLGRVGEEGEDCFGPRRDMKLTLQHVILLLCHFAEPSALLLRPPASGAAAGHPRMFPETRADRPNPRAGPDTAGACHPCARELALPLPALANAARSPAALYRSAPRYPPMQARQRGSTSGSRAGAAR